MKKSLPTLKIAFAIIIAAMQCIAPAAAQTANDKALADSLENALAETKEYKEQVRILHDIIDIDENNLGNSDWDHEYLDDNRLLLKLATKNDDEHIQLEAIRVLGTNTGDHKTIIDSISLYIKKAEALPANDEQREVLVYLRCSKVQMENNYEEDSVNYNNLVKMIGEFNNKKDYDNIYDRTEQLLSLCDIMYKISPGDLYISYLKQLGDLMEKLPADGNSILPRVYVTLAANSYSFKGMQKEALEANLKALQQIKDLKERYDREKRFYHSYGRFEYVIYRRMLMSPDAMTQAQLDSCYAKIQGLANSNKIVKKDFEAPGSISKIRYYMATKRYKEAIPYLDLRLDQKDKYKPIWNECIKYRITAGKALGNDKDLDKYALQYIDCLERQQEQDLAAKARELQIAYDVSALEHQVSQLELEKKESQIRSSRIFIAASLTAFAVLLIMLMSVLRSKRELATMNDDLKEARSKAENANRMKTMFIQNMNHEIRTPLNAITGFSKLMADDNGSLTKEEKSTYSGIISDNSDMLLTMVNDLLDISELETGKMKFSIAPCSMDDVCRAAISSCKSKVPEGVALQFAHLGPDVQAKTDKQRVAQVIINFISNACKNTEKGSITVDYGADATTRTITLSVTDTGKGVPADKAGTIFQRFEKLDSFKEGTGIGLNICALIADGLKGEVKLDQSYAGGARFLFTFPC